MAPVYLVVRNLKEYRQDKECDKCNGNNFFLILVSGKKMASEIKNLLLGSNPLNVDFTLNVPVEQETMDVYVQLNEKVDDLARRDILVKNSEELHMLCGQITDLIVKFDEELARNVDRTTISQDQNDFLVKLSNLVVAFNTFFSVVSHIDHIANIYQKLKNLALIDELKTDSIKDILALSSTGTDGGSDFADSTKRTWNQRFEDILGVDRERTTIQSILKSTVFSDSYNFIIMYGPPGTGKSTLAQAIATEHSKGVAYVLNMTELLDPVVGVAERGIKSIFGLAESQGDQAMTIVLDEMDTVFSVDNTNQVIQNVRTALQTEIEGARKLTSNLVVVGITNYYKKLTDAIKRRSTAKILVDIPDPQTLPYFVQYYLLGPELIVQNVQLGQSFVEGLAVQLQTMANQNLVVTNANMKNICIAAKNSYFQQTSNFTIFAISQSKLLLLTNSLDYSNWGEKATTEANYEGLFEAKKRNKNLQIVVVPELHFFIDAFERVEFMSQEAALSYRET